MKKINKSNKLTSGGLYKCIKEFKAVKEDIFLKDEPFDIHDTLMVKISDIVLFLKEIDLSVVSYGKSTIGKVSILLIDNKKYVSYNETKLRKFLQRIG